MLGGVLFLVACVIVGLLWRAVLPVLLVLALLGGGLIYWNNQDGIARHAAAEAAATAEQARVAALPFCDQLPPEADPPQTTEDLIRRYTDNVCRHRNQSAGAAASEITVAEPAAAQQAAELAQQQAAAAHQAKAERAAAAASQARYDQAHRCDREYVHTLDDAGFLACGAPRANLAGLRALGVCDREWMARGSPENDALNEACIRAARRLAPPR